jgi:hypothetical protein
MGARRGLGAEVVAVAQVASALALSLAGTARAAKPLGLGDCGKTEVIYQCSGLVKTWDGVPLDTTVTLPSAHRRNLPLVVEIHGFGNSKYEYLDPNSTAYTDNAFDWARDGYAVLTYTARGLWGSCGTPESRVANPVGEPFIPGRPMGFLAPPGTDPEADVTSWVKRTDQGEPYEGEDIDFIVNQLRRYHSAYYIKADERPAPLFVGSGFTDDLFPVDEALRFANRTKKRYSRAPMSLLFGDLGHQRTSNKPRDRARLLRAIHAWFDHYLRGRSGHPREGVTAYVDTCPRSAPSLGPFHARTFARLSDRAVRFASDKPQSLLSTGGDPSIGAALDPVAGGGNACASVSARPEPGTATYDLRRRHRAATLLGAPSIRARLAVGGSAPDNAQIAAASGTSPATARRRPWSRAAPTGHTSAGTRGSSIRRGGGSRRATRRGSSCWTRTRHTRAPRTASSRWT